MKINLILKFLPKEFNQKFGQINLKNYINYFKQYTLSLLNIMFGQQCLLCDKIISQDQLFCNEDWQKIKFIPKKQCDICAEPIINDLSKINDFDQNLPIFCLKCLKNRPFFDKTTTIFIYEKNIKSLIANLKYDDATFLAKKFAKIIAQKLEPIASNYDIITAVPLNKNKLHIRKYNQAALLAHYVYKHFQYMRFVPDLLIKVKNTVSQTNFDRKQRQINLREAFIINPKYKNQIIAKNILLIDDVITTCSTANYCSKVLKDNNCNEIRIVTIAKTLLQNTN